MWNEVLDVYGPARRTDCFLSIGTGISQNKHLGKPGIISQADFAENLSAVATNSQLLHVLFKTLINAYAPSPGLKKYWRLNIGEEIEEYDNYKDVGDLDDVGKMDMIREMTEKYMKLNDGLITECSDAVRNSFNRKM